jgi:CheY-like chemotaxis protein
MNRAAARPLVAGDRSSTKPVVLVVEDDVMVRAATSHYLRGCAFTVVEAVSADEALTILRGNPSIQAVFADVKLPGTLDGLDLARAIQRDYRHLKVLLTSGVAPFGAVEGITLMKKPYFLFEVERQIRSMLGLGPGGPC